MMGADEVGPWPTPRYTALRERGRSIMAEDLELWDDDIKRAFGFDGPNAELSQEEPHRGDESAKAPG